MNRKNRQTTIRTAFRRFPFNGLRIISSFMSMARRKKEAHFPFKVQQESTTICNLKCKMCPQNNMTRKKGHLKFEVFKKMYDEVRPPYLNLTGTGEPLMNPDFFKIVGYAKKRGSFVKMDTNGVFLTKENAKKLLDTKVDTVSFSIDGITKKVYEKIRVGANFDVVVANLKNFIRMRNERKSRTEIHVFFVIQKDNYWEFPNFIRWADSIGVNSASGTFIGEESYAENRKNDISSIPPKEIEKLKAGIIKACREVRVNAEIDWIMEYMNTWKEKRAQNFAKVCCYKPWYSPYITWDGLLVLCHYCVDNEIVLGDLKKEKFGDLWNGKKMQAYREMIATNREGLCARCGSNEEYIREYIKKNPILRLLKND